jgi:hypothetical protein
VNVCHRLVRASADTQAVAQSRKRERADDPKKKKKKKKTRVLLPICFSASLLLSLCAQATRPPSFLVPPFQASAPAASSPSFQFRTAFRKIDRSFFYFQDLADD